MNVETNPAIGWNEIVVSLGGQKFNAFKAVSYKDSVERGKLRGNSMRVLQKTTGVHDNEAAFEMAFSEYRAFIKFLGDGFMKRRFHVSVSYTDDDGTGENTSPEVFTDEFDAKLKEIDNSHTQSSEPLFVKVPLDVIGAILYDGVDPLGSFTP